MKMSRIMYLSSYIFILLNVFSTPVLSITPEELGAIVEATEEGIYDIQIEYEILLSDKLSEEEIRGTDIVQSKSGIKKITWAGMRPFSEYNKYISEDEYIDGYGKDWLVINKSVYAGQVAKKLTKTNERGTDEFDGTITKSKRFIPSLPISPDTLTSKRVEQLYEIRLSELLINPQYPVIVEPDAMEINGFSCVAVDFNMVGTSYKFMRVYFAENYGYTPIKFEHYNANTPAMTLDIFELEEISNGLWFPKKATLTSTDSKQQESKNIFMINKVIANQGLDRSFFSLEFPPGTFVIDEIVGVEYYSKPTEMEFEQWLKNQEIIASNKKIVSPSQSSPKATINNMNNKEQITEKKQIQTSEKTGLASSVSKISYIYPVLIIILITSIIVFCIRRITRK